MFLEMIGGRTNFKEQYGGKTFQELEYLPQDMDHSPQDSTSRRSVFNIFVLKSKLGCYKGLQRRFLSMKKKYEKKTTFLKVITIK